MTTIDDGGPAFPEITTTPETASRWDGDSDRFVYGHVTSSGGMSLRDYFAGQALAGMCSLESLMVAKCAHDASPRNRSRRGEKTAEAAYRLADAMLAVRARKP